MRAWLREREEAFPQWAAAHPGVWDFSPESVERLQEVLDAEFTSIDQIYDVRTTFAVTVPAWYLGEVCVRLGASWKHTYVSPIDADDWKGPFLGIAGDPMENPGFVMPEGKEHLHPAVHPVTAVCDAPHGGPDWHLRNAVVKFDMWRRAAAGEPVTYAERLRDNPRLRAWLGAQEAAFPGWVAAHPGVWDFSPESIDRLQVALKAEFTSWEHIDAEQYTLKVSVPAWYFGEVCVRAGGVWKCDPDDVDDSESWLGPSVGVPGDPSDDPDYEDPYEEFLPLTRPISELRGMFAKSPEWRLRSVVEDFETWRPEAAD